MSRPSKITIMDEKSENTTLSFEQIGIGDYFLNHGELYIKINYAADPNNCWKISERKKVSLPRFEPVELCDVTISFVRQQKEAKP
jgi:hypothetical protein